MTDSPAVRRIAQRVVGLRHSPIRGLISPDGLDDDVKSFINLDFPSGNLEPIFTIAKR